MRDEAIIHDIERAMIGIARSMGRRDLGRQIERQLGSRIDTAFIQAIGTIDELTRQQGAPTIKDIARALDVHHSRASRLVKDTIRAGLLMRLASQEDARKSPLALSDKGREIADAIHDARAKYFAARLRGFSRDDRRNLAQLLVRFVQNDAPANAEFSGKDARHSVQKLRKRERRKSGA